MESLWRKQTGKLVSNVGREGTRKDIERARKDIEETLTDIDEGRKVDIIVIGAGMAGLLIAWYLKEQGRKVLVLEADEIASGQTERTTAKISSQHDLKYHYLIEKVGLEKARLYARANEAAIREYERIIHKHGIKCQFEKTSAYLYSRENETMLKEEARAAAMVGIDAFFTKETELPFSVTGAVEFRHQAQFSPLEFIKFIAGELEIREHTRVVAVKGRRVIARREMGIMQPPESNREAGLGLADTIQKKELTLQANEIVVATHYPILNVPGFYFLRQHQERSYVLALEGCERIKGMYLGIDEEGLSFRQAGEYLLLGGCSQRTGKNTCGNAYDRLREAAKEYYPHAGAVARWAAQDCMPHDGIPFIGRYSVFTPHVYVATGFQKWGMTTSMVAAMLLRDILCGIENPYEEVFSPQRLNVRAGTQAFLQDVGESIKGLARGLVSRPRCSHMGCKLVWNPQEHSWDCPCHGSRFAADGRILNNPTKRKINT